MREVERNKEALMVACAGRVELPQDGGRVEVDIDGVQNKRETLKLPS